MIPAGGLVDVERWDSSDAQQRRDLARELILPRVLERGGARLDADFNPSQRLRNRYASEYAELVDSLKSLPDWREQIFGCGVPYVARCFQSALARSKDANTSEVDRMRDFAPLWIVDLDNPAIPPAAQESIRSGVEAAVSEYVGWLPDNALDLLEKSAGASGLRRTIELHDGDTRTTIRNGDLVFVRAGATLRIGNSKEAIAPEPDWSGSVRFVSMGKGAHSTASDGSPPAHWFVRALAVAPATFYPIGMATVGEPAQAMWFHLLWLVLFSWLWIARHRLRLPSLWRYWLLSGLPMWLIVVAAAMGLVAMDRQGPVLFWVPVLGACLYSAVALLSLFKKTRFRGP